MRKKYLLLTIVTALSISAYSQQVIDIDFSKQDQLKDNVKISGSKECISTAQGKIIYSSKNGDMKKYRWLNLKALAPLVKNFSVECNFGINYLDHWNGIKQVIQSESGGWIVELQRRQQIKGQNELVLITQIEGKKNVMKIQETAKELSFRIVRKEDLLFFYCQANNGDWHEVFQPVKVTTKNARATINCWSPPNSSSQIIIRKFKLETEPAVSSVNSPVYQSSSVICSIPQGNMKIVWTEKSQVGEKGIITVNPSGKVVFAFQGPLNLKKPVLNWQSSGSIKLAIAQPGTSETIKLSETLVWDQENTEIPAEMTSRSFSINQFALRYSYQRNWKHEHQTANNIFFVCFKPAGSKPIKIKDLTLSGSPLLMLCQPKTNYNLKVEAENKEEFTLLKWPLEKQPANVFDFPDTFSQNQKFFFAGIPFFVSPMILSESNNSVAFETDSRAGMIYIAHTAGPVVKKNNSLVATYVMVYDDNTTETIFAQLRWNCGVYSSNFLSRGIADYTWWGPPGFTWASAHYVPIGTGIRWNSVYVTKYINPHPGKSIKKIIAVQNTSTVKSFAILGISLKSPAQTSVGILDPESALLYPGENLPVNLMYWTAFSAGDMSSKIPVNITKPNKKLNVGEINFNINGQFGYGSGSIIISENNISPGPVRLLCKDIYSSLLGLMPTEKNSPRKNNYTMIAGGAESSAEFERMRKLGYDAVKIQIPWTNKEEPSRGQYNWSEWIERMERIRKSGLNIEIRNPRRQGPDWLRKNASFMYEMRDKKQQLLEREYDPANTFFRNALIDYYREIGKLAKRFPEVISINANYGVRFRVGNKNSLLFGTDQLKSFRQYLEKRYKITEINALTNQTFKDFSEITAESVTDDSSNFLLNEYVRHYQTLGATLQWDVAKAIRENSNVHLTFNHPYNSTEWTRTGTQLETYLRIGKELGPGSPFHETSDRYSLSFRKWLCAKTFSLEYGDEGFQNPPTYEHNALSYQWMTWTQCWDALYCQWWGGRPGNQNIAWIKPYSRMIYNAKYLSDPITLALSFESDIHEARDVLSKGLHSTTGNHYGLVNTLLSCNLNAARYIFDKFPQQDKFASKLVIDDSSRYISDAFAQRIIEHIRNGGVFVTTPETDRLNEYAFFKRNGISVGKDGSFTGKNLIVLFEGGTHIPEVKIKEIGKGKLVMLNKPYHADFDPTAPPSYLALMRKLFASLGEFQPLVHSSKQGVYVCPYRTDNGNILLYVFNITAGEKKTQLKLRKDIIESPIVHDLRAGSNCSISSNDDYYSLEIKVPPLSSTVIKFQKNRRNQWSW